MASDLSGTDAGEEAVGLELGVGLALAVVAFANILFLILVDMISTNPNPYMGILAYMVMPAFLILGLLLVVVGIVRSRFGRAPKPHPRRRVVLKGIWGFALALNAFTLGAQA